VQTTLLGLAMIFILALVAALVGPLFVDWNQYRSVFEAEASRLVGLPVRVRGAIDARILPTPSLTLNGIEIGQAGDTRLRAGALDVEFALGPLMRGDWHAAQLRLTGPQLGLGLDRAGRVDWPSAAIGLDPEALSVQRMIGEDGRIVLSDAASGAQATLDKLSFRGDLRALIGPFRGEGGFIARGERYAYRISAGRFGDDGIRLRIALDAADRPLAVEADGLVALERGAPRFDGSVTLARIAGLARSGGQTVLNEPWRVSSRVKATRTTALLDQIEVQYGPEERALRLTGTAELKLGTRPRLDGVLSARQLDLDRALLDTTKRLPLASIRSIAETFGASRIPIPMQLGLSIDTMTLAGGTLQSVRGDMRIDGAGWELEKLEFRGPGLSQIQLSGRLAFAPDGLAFRGPARVESSDPRALIGWIEGRNEPPQTQARPLRLQGDVTFGETIAVERLKAELDRETIEGRVVYRRSGEGRPARLEAALTAADFDVDAAIAFAKAALAGTALERPGEMVLAVDVGRAGFAGYIAREAHARLRLDPDGVQIDRLSVADMGGAAFAAYGRMETAMPSPRGNMHVDLDARELAPIAALLATVAPQAADRLRRDAERLAPAKLQARLSIGAAAAATDTATKLGIDGRLGGLRVSLFGEAVGNAADMLGAHLRIDGRLEADDGGFLGALIGIDKLVAVDRQPGRLTFSAGGPLKGDVRVGGRLGAGGLDVAAEGTVQLLTDQGAKAALLVTASGDAKPLRGTVRPTDPLPVTFTGRMSLAGSAARIEEFSGTVAGARVRGKLDLALGPPAQVDGEIETESIEAISLLAAAVGLRTTGTNAWSSDPFAPGIFGETGGRIAFKAARAVLTPALVARQARGVLRLGRAEIALEDVEAELAGGKLVAQLEFRNSADGLAARGRLGLTGADAAAVIPASSRPPIAGRLAVQLDAEGSGRSPAALFGSLAGGGTVALEGAQLAGLDTKAFDVAMRAADQGLAIDAPRVRDLVSGALDTGRLGVPQMDGAISIRAGQARLGQTIARADGADLALAGHVDLSENLLDARLTLTGTKVIAGGGRPEIFLGLKGPIPAARRTVDVSALVGWLTLRAIDQQASRLEAIENSRKSSPAVESDDPGTSSVLPLPPPTEVRPAPAPAPYRRPALRESGPLAPELRPRPRAPASRVGPPLDLLRPEN
jgi:AsmA family/AsmA-like C-terminal region